jgi:long-chain acyl-CoA synthetase
LRFGAEVLTRDELAKRSAGVAHALREAGIGPGATVAQLIPNSPETIAATFGVWLAGAVLCPINPSSTPREITQVLEDCSPAAVLARRSMVATLADELRHRGRWISVDDVMSSEREPLAVAVDPESPAMLMYTSGTSGTPKGVLLSHRSILLNNRQVARRTGISDADRLLVFTPLFHVNGLCNQMLLSWRVGASVVLRPRFIPEEFWTTLRDENVTYFTAPPTIYTRIRALGRPGGLQLPSLRFARTGAAPMPTSVQLECEGLLEVPIVDSYGLTECTTTCTMNPVGWGRRIGSVGTAFDELDVVIRRDDDSLAAVGEVGEVTVAGGTLMLRYLNRPQETAEALRGGYLRTGDLGYLDTDGFLYLIDRKKDIINRGGQKISPREVEAVLLEHPLVADVVVAGVPDEEYGQEIKALVVRKSEVLAVEELRELCYSKLSRYKVPRFIDFVAELPKSSVGKLLRSAIAGSVPEGRT